MSENGWLPGEADLGRLWTAAAEVAGGTVTGWRCTHLDVQAGESVTAAATVGIAWPDGSRTDETLGASTSAAAAGALRMADGEHEVGVWRFPHDPALPGLAAACDPARMRQLVARLGFGDVPVNLGVRAYRPCRRAVVEVRTPDTSLFVKVVRPHRIEELHRLHRDAEGAPVPESLAWTGDGLLVLTARPGRSLRRQLLDGDSGLPEPDRLVELLRGLPGAFAERGPRPGWASRARHYASVVATVLPEAGDSAHAVADAVRTVPEPLVPVHGDCYDSQLLVEDGAISGLLDIDTAHAGDGYDDPACLLGHLGVLAQVRPDRRAAIDDYAGRCLGAFERHWDPEPLRARAAAVVLSLATGPHRVREPGWQEAVRQRLGLAHHWLSGERTLVA